MAVVQSTYRETMHPATAGMPADMRNWDGITRTCETAAGIGFGLAVSRGDEDPETKCKLGGTLPDFLGASFRDITLEARTTDSDEYADGENVGICATGTLWVVVSGSPTVDSPVHFNASTGVFASSGGTGPIIGARFMSDPVTVHDNVQVIKLSLGNPNQAAT